MLPTSYSFQLVNSAKLAKTADSRAFSGAGHALDVGGPSPVGNVSVQGISDEHRRMFLRALGVVGLGAVGASFLPTRSEALVMGSSPSTGVVGVRDASNVRINPAVKEGTGILKKSVMLTSSGTVHSPSSGKSIKVYNNRFSLTADMTSVSFRFTSGGTDYEVYLSPRSGGLYGANNQPNYVQGNPNQDLYCVITGTGTVQINLDYVEV